MAPKVFVGNLSFHTTADELRELFQQAGDVRTVRIIHDQFTGRSMGFAFVEMATKKELDKAVDMLDGTVFRGRTLVVDEARLQARTAEDERKARASDCGGGGKAA